MRPSMSIVVPVLVLSAWLTGCATLPDDYFKQNVGKATQAEVTARLGSPDHRYAMENGESKWVYIIHVSTATYLTYANTDAEVCYNYDLIFDDKQVLKTWKTNNKACGTVN